MIAVGRTGPGGTVLANGRIGYWEFPDYYYDDEATTTSTTGGDDDDDDDDDDGDGGREDGSYAVAE